jgi:ATP phosphoribosyltransferase regulatory subunit HisZ
VTDVTADFHGGDGDQADARVLDFATDQLGQLALHLIADTLGTAVFFCHFCYLF